MVDWLTASSAWNDSRIQAVYLSLSQVGSSVGPRRFPTHTSWGLRSAVAILLWVSECRVVGPVPESKGGAIDEQIWIKENHLGPSICSLG